MNTVHFLFHIASAAISNSEIGRWPPTRWVGDPDEWRDDAPEGYCYIPGAPMPEHDPETEIAERTPPTLDGWGWTVRNLTPQELAARRVMRPGVSKLTLARRLGLETGYLALEAAIATMPAVVQRAWGLAQEVSLDDEIIQAYGPDFCTLLSMTEEEMVTLLTP